MERKGLGCGKGFGAQLETNLLPIFYQTEPSFSCPSQFQYYFSTVSGLLPSPCADSQVLMSAAGASTWAILSPPVQDHACVTCSAPSLPAWVTLPFADPASTELAFWLSLILLRILTSYGVLHLLCPLPGMLFIQIFTCLSHDFIFQNPCQILHYL